MLEGPGRETWVCLSVAVGFWGNPCGTLVVVLPLDKGRVVVGAGCVLSVRGHLIRVPFSLKDGRLASNDVQSSEIVVISGPSRAGGVSGLALLFAGPAMDMEQGRGGNSVTSVLGYCCWGWIRSRVGCVGWKLFYRGCGLSLPDLWGVLRL